jgi:ankyrin repeat protein
VNAVNRYGVPPLAQACTNGNAAIVKLLLEAGADANATMKGGETVPHVGCALRECRGGEGAALARRQPKTLRTARARTALMWAAAEGHTAVIRALIDAEPTSMRRSTPGSRRSSLPCAAATSTTVRAFLSAGADVNAMMQRPDGARRDKLP